ncbi:MAG: Omp28-related outer membrane protein [Prevotella sp.]|nr:Omp28-related outer membrane protein [Prevotella sp.]
MINRTIIAFLIAVLAPQLAGAQARQLQVNTLGPAKLAIVQANSVSIARAGALKADGLSANQRLVGYTVTDDIDVKGAAFGTAGTYTIGALFTPQMLASYEGCPIVGLRIAAAMNLGRSRTFIYNIDELGLTPLVEQNQRIYEGWNNVFFNGEGYKIKGTEMLFFGFDYNETEEMVSADEGGICSVGDDTEGAFYLYGTYNGRTDLYAIENVGKLCVQLIVDVSSLPAHDLDMTYLDTGFKYKQPGDTIEALAMFTNVGRETVSGFQVGYQLDDRQPVLRTVTDSALVVGASDSWQFVYKLPQDIEVGTHLFKVFVSQVGGEPMPERSHNDTLTASFAVYRDSLQRQKAYLEVYTDASSYYSALLNDAIKLMCTRPDLSDKLALVNVHRPGSALAVSEAAYLHTLYAYTWPTFTINRSYFPGEAYIAYDMNYYLDYQTLLGAEFNAGIIGDMVFQDYYSPSFADITLQVGYDANTRQLTVTATGKVLPEADAIYGDLALTLMVVEDEVKSSQATVNFTTGRVSTNRSYLHPQVLRGYLTAPTGVALQVVDGQYTVTANATLNSQWDADKVTIVGLLTKRADTITSDNLRDYDVINATSCLLTQVSGIATMADVPSLSPVARFTLDGKRIDASAAVKGIVIERMADGSVRKVYHQ